MTQENIIETVESVTIDVKVDKTKAFALVNEGTSLRREIEEKTNRLEQIKAELREFAKVPAAFHVTDTGTVEIRDPETENCAQVCPQKDTPVLIKEADTSVLAGLTQGQFDITFRRVVTMQPVEKFEAAFNNLPKKAQNLIRKVVSWRPNAPQVKFSK